MTKIDFYELKLGRFTPDQLLCALCLKTHQNKKTALLLTQSEQQSQHLNKALWLFEDVQFIPHGINEPNQALNSINISHQTQANEQYDILININDTIPEHIGQFARVIELVHEHSKNTAREHYRYYKDRGYPIKYNQV